MLEDNIIYSCSNSILSILSTVTGLPVWKRQDSITDAPDQIRREAERFYLWSRGYSSEGENLKYYPESIHIQFTALSTLYELGTVIKNCLLPCLDIQLPMVDISREIYRLETGLEKLLAALVEGGYEVVDYNPPPGSKNDEAALSSALEDIRVLIDCLMELSLASDDFRTEHDDSAPKYIISDSFGVSSHNALVICQNIHERFPLVPRWLIRRFGEAYSATSESFYKAELELAVEEAEEAEIPGGQNTPAPTGSLYNFTHPAARSMSHGTPSTTPLYPIGQGRMRMLQLPRAIQNGKSHTCEICSKTLNNTTSLGEWK
ncbi:hypothetical protein F5Y04DRAFT_286999 [Hypomontagnella monticulosa]|nr:hypothetical protein F5Y04DRAFT_286999 [Hypomontagnella monticulosa]